MAVWFRRDVAAFDTVLRALETSELRVQPGSRSFYVVDCARSALNATCEVIGERTVQCGESNTSFL